MNIIESFKLHIKKKFFMKGETIIVISNTEDMIACILDMIDCMILQRRDYRSIFKVKQTELRLAHLMCFPPHYFKVRGSSSIKLGELRG